MWIKGGERATYGVGQVGPILLTIRDFCTSLKQDSITVGVELRFLVGVRTEFLAGLLDSAIPKTD